MPSRRAVIGPDARNNSAKAASTPLASLLWIGRSISTLKTANQLHRRSNRPGNGPAMPSTRTWFPGYVARESDGGCASTAEREQSECGDAHNRCGRLRNRGKHQVVIAIG
jgi:hypothetical protein